MREPSSQNLHNDARLLRAERLYPGNGDRPLFDQVIEINDGMITAITDAERVDPALVASRHDIIAPGFIDLQINGAGGVLFNDAPNEETLRRMRDAARTGGTCHFLPTFITAKGDAYLQAMDAVARCDDPEILGLHLEGPFLSPDRPGIHPPEHIRRITDVDILALCGFNGRLLLTLAPEEVDANAITTLREAGIALFAGHTNCDSELIEKSHENGIAGVTHLYNACSQITPRAPGVVGAALAHQTLYAGIIADGIHVHPRALALAAKCMAGRLFLVSDTMPSYGGGIQAFTVGGKRIELVEGRLQSSGGTLAGAHLGLDEAVRNMVTLADVEPAQALHMASGVPAAVLGLQDRYGMIAVGRNASLSCLARDLTAEAVMIHGRYHPV